MWQSTSTACLILALLPKPASADSVSRVAPLGKDGTSTRLIYENFLPSDSAAKEGLDAILAGRVFSPSGVPVRAYQTLSSQAPHDGNTPPPSDQNAWDQFRVFGHLPSPPNRAQGLPEVGETNLGISVVQVGRCYDKEHDVKKVVALPFQGHSSCEIPAQIDSTKIFVVNCMSCHTGTVAGRVIGGLANTTGDQAGAGMQLAKVQYALDPSYVEGGGQSLGDRWVRELMRWWLTSNLSAFEKSVLESYLEYNQTIVLPVFANASSRGDNLGPYWVWKYLSRLVTDGGDDVRFDTIPRNQKAPLDELIFKKDTLKLATVDPNPWWHMKFKKHVYWYKEPNRFGKDFAFNFTQPHEGVSANHTDHVKTVEKALDYARSTHSPQFPYIVDWQKVERGVELFHSKPLTTLAGTKTCSNCHGVYEHLAPQSFQWRVDYPDFAVSLENVRTDPLYPTLSQFLSTNLQGPLKHVYDKGLRRYGADYVKAYVPQLSIPEKIQVIAPPLVGLWASAPYFHNGSVPTLFEVLRPARRSPIWSRAVDAAAYNPVEVGLVYDEKEQFDRQYRASGALPKASEIMDPTLVANMIAHSKKHYFKPESLEFRRKFITNLPGKGNSGHDWMADWSDDDVWAVIEFLKTVSGPQVVPLSPSNGL